MQWLALTWNCSTALIVADRELFAATFGRALSDSSNTVFRITQPHGEIGFASEKLSKIAFMRLIAFLRALMAALR